MASRDRHDGRNVALIGGAAVLAWWLLRGARRGLGANATTASADSSATTPREPCRVWIRADRFELDGIAADLASVVASCRARGRAEVRATGGAITRSIMDALRALQGAGVSIDASPDLQRLARLAVEGAP